MNTGQIDEKPESIPDSSRSGRIFPDSQKMGRLLDKFATALTTQNTNKIVVLSEHRNSTLD
ncbi:hypothetical protein CH373_00830 [Leptospira perolatii]|uniref:Uncharacterized protein n=1 Tax=Leptospira perolatii TaxID=2023191 RepID=A0A2M9ZRN5_9LEPT|nr:hypothetical protein CH360_00830 [Leptospira perolatii]PJZ74629.1 hypothetical protein CH373_00830 [Leptospira perolatii]